MKEGFRGAEGGAEARRSCLCSTVHDAQDETQKYHQLCPWTKFHQKSTNVSLLGIIDNSRSRNTNKKLTELCSVLRGQRAASLISHIQVVRHYLLQKHRHVLHTPNSGQINDGNNCCMMCPCRHTRESRGSFAGLRVRVWTSHFVPQES